MGVKTNISLDELNGLFTSYKFTKIIPTTSGIIDTTYIVHTATTGYILKKYERDVSKVIESDIVLLRELKTLGFNTPKPIDKKESWHLYEKLEGEQPKNIKTYHILSLARFLSKFHQHTHKRSHPLNIIDKNEIESLLNYVRSSFYAYSKKLEPLVDYIPNSDGVIHGDIFKDNTVFNEQKIGVFDFIDSAHGDFALECGVALIGFDAGKSNYFINLFLNTYNQHAPRKLSKKELLKSIDIASRFYALKRVYKYKNTKKARELVK